MRNFTLSVVVPFYNEEGNLPKLHKELIEVLGETGIASEIVYVDDGSTDSSVSSLLKNAKRGKVKIKLVRLRRNIGQTAAIAAGIKHSEGDLISFIDADLQNDPRDIPRFLEKLNEGYDAVFGWRRDRKDATLRSILSKTANVIISRVFSFPYHDVGCSARVVKKEFLQKIELYGESHRIMPVLIYLKGAKVGEIVVKHRERASGKSKYGFERIIKTVIDILTVRFLHSYGTKPAYVFGSVGLGSIMISGLVLLAVAYRKIFLGVFVHRDPLFLIAIFFGLLGTQFVLMGLLAELQVRTYFGLRKKTSYEIRSVREI